MQSYQIRAEVTGKERLTGDIIRLSLRAPEVAKTALPGQFVMVKVASGLEPLLRRPLSIHQCASNETVRILFKVVGKGTRLLADIVPGGALDIIGPLGHGFVLPAAPCQNVCLVGGGMGIAPLYFLAREMLNSRPDIQIKLYLGAAKGSELQVLAGEFAALGCEVAVATDDGSMGYSGFVTDLLRQTLPRGLPWQVYSCGPYPMMKKVVEFCQEEKWSCQVSLETMMACGISACLGCTVPSSPTHPQQNVTPYLHVCKDGPVFDSGDVAWSR